MGCMMCLLLLWGRVDAQPVSTNMALNHYVAFANECIHMLGVIQVALENSNEDLVAWQAGTVAIPPKYAMHKQLHSFAYYGWRQGVCTRIPDEKDPINNIRRLYQTTKTESGQIPERYLTGLNTYRDELMYIMIEVWSLSDSLEKHMGKTINLERGSSTPDKFQQIFHRLAILFHDFQAMRDKLAFALKEVAGPGPVELTELRQLLFHSQQLIQAVRHDINLGVEMQLAQLRMAIDVAERTQDARIASMKKMDLYFSRDLTGYRYLIQHARDILQVGEAYARSEARDPVMERYGRNHFFYNRRLLPRYNHAENGMVAYYNSFVRFANRHLIQQVEEVAWFKVLEIPPVALPPDSADRDRLESDTPPETHVVNHLVFLLDVSASMNKPEKLPLLKGALARLMEFMRAEDRISIVSYSGNAKLVLTPTSALRTDEITQAIENLRSGGMTHFRQGMRIAYQAAQDHFIEGGNNRIILATDGAFRITPATLRKVQRKSDREIPLSVFFLGKKMAQKTSLRLEELAKAGEGNFAHITDETADGALRKEVRSLRE